MLVLSISKSARITVHITVRIAAVYILEHPFFLECCYLVVVFGRFDGNVTSQEKVVTCVVELVARPSVLSWVVMIHLVCNIKTCNKTCLN